MSSTTILIFLVLLSGSLAADLFTFVANPPVGTEKIKACQSEGIKSCSVVEVNFGALDGEVLTLPGDWSLSLLDAPTTDSATFTDDNGTEATFTRARNMEGDFHAIGNVDFADGRDFMLEPCGAFLGCHVWMEADKSTWNMEKGPVMEVSEEEKRYAVMNMRTANSALIQKGTEDSTTVVTYSVMFYYTPEFATATADIPLFISQVVAETNQGYINSKVPLRVKAHCTQQTAFNEVSDADTMLNTFRASKPIAELLNTADVAHLFVNSCNYCGLAQFDSFKYGTNTGLTLKACALGIYTVGHEIGHNFGLTHDKYQGANSAYSYGLGHHIPGTNKMTIMAYPHEGNTREINYYSAPDVYYQGILTGSELLNNARVLRENRFAIVAVGDESGSCSGSSGTTAPALTGEVKSENYPQAYTNNLDKTYTIEVGAGKKIKISFNHLDIESHSSCNYDYVMITDSNGATLLTKTCGTTKPADVTSATNKAVVTFHSDYSVAQTGFRLTWVEV